MQFVIVLRIMDIVLIIVGILCMLVGLVGCIVPVLPGVPIAYVGLLVLHATDKVQFSWGFLLIWGVITVVVQVFDVVVPVWGTKKMGGSKAGVWGSTIGLIVGFFCGIWGAILGPFIGAVIGELITQRKKGIKSFGKAVKAGAGAFVGLLTGIVLKLITVGVMCFFFVKALF